MKYIIRYKYRLFITSTHKTVGKTHSYKITHTALSTLIYPTNKCFQLKRP